MRVLISDFVEHSIDTREITVVTVDTLVCDRWTARFLKWLLSINVSLYVKNWVITDVLFLWENLESADILAAYISLGSPVDVPSNVDTKFLSQAIQLLMSVVTSVRFKFLLEAKNTPRVAVKLVPSHRGLGRLTLENPPSDTLERLVPSPHTPSRQPIGGLLRSNTRTRLLVF